ncbi:MAG TPA: DUF1080 domain-containing protein, partial [Lacunisphaera sp.]|nr:DUF1080 domain-containing protein [Lacunisphaera sp.]
MPNTLSDAERAAGWRMLWDGHASRGWHGAKGVEFPAAGWSMADGVLTVLGTKGEAKGGDIVTVEEFAAFELQLEFQV